MEFLAYIGAFGIGFLAGHLFTRSIQEEKTILHVGKSGILKPEYFWSSDQEPAFDPQPGDIVPSSDIYSLLLDVDGSRSDIESVALPKDES